MSPGKKRRYSTTPLKPIDYCYMEHVASLVAEGNNEQITEYLSKISDEWKRLYPKSHAVLLAATSGAENTAESQSQSRRITGEGSLSDVSAIGHQQPEVFLNSPTTSGMKLDESIQNPEINQSTAVIASVAIPKQKDTGEKSFQSQICTGKKYRLDTASPRYRPPPHLGSARTRPIIRDTGEGSLSDVTAIGHQLPEVFLNSPTTSGMKLDESIQNPEMNQSTAAIASVEIPEQKDTGEKRFQSQICTGKKSRLDTASPRYTPPLLLGSARTRPIIRDLIQDTTTKSSTVVTEPVEISGLEGTSRVLDATSLCHQPSQESLSSSISGDMRPADSAKELSTEFNPESFTLAKMPTQEEIALARDEFVQELEHIVNDYENHMPTGPFSGNENDEHFNTFLTQFTEKIQYFRQTLQQSLATISEMELSPFLNVPMLLILVLKVINSRIDVEKMWVECSHLREGNSNPDMTNMTQYYCCCYQRATATYLMTIPEEFLKKVH